MLSREMMSAYRENPAKHKWAILVHVPCIFLLLLLQPTNAQICVTIFSLSYNVHSYMSRHLCVINREFRNLYFSKLHKFLKLKLLKLQCHKNNRLKYCLFIAE